jgi:hypothetical protein
MRLVVENAVADADANAQVVGRQRAEFGEISRGTGSKAFTATRNKGLNVSFEVEGNSLRSARSRLTPRAEPTRPAFAEVYAMINPRP